MAARGTESKEVIIAKLLETFGGAVRYNKEIAAEYLQYLKQMSEDFGIDNDIRVSSLSKYPDVFSMEDAELDEEEMWSILKRAVDGAGEEFAAARAREI